MLLTLPQYHPTDDNLEMCYQPLCPSVITESGQPEIMGFLTRRNKDTSPIILANEQTLQLIKLLDPTCILQKIYRKEPVSMKKHSDKFRM